MVAAAELLEGELPATGELLTSEMGKTFASAKGEAAKCAMTMRYYAEHAGSILADRARSRPTASRSGVRYEPLGPIFAVMPWNFPLWQVIRFAAPGIMAGNVALLKHASNVPGAAKYLEELFVRAGVPRGRLHHPLRRPRRGRPGHRRPPGARRDADRLGGRRSRRSARPPGAA